MQYPLINGKRRDFSSLELVVSGLIFTGVKAVDYSDSLEPGIVYGTGALPIGTTRGQYKAQGSITLYRAEFDALIATLGDAYMEKYFDVVASYADDGDSAVTVDTLVGCRIKNVGNSHSSGGDALEMKIDLHVHYIKRNGTAPLGKLTFVQAAAAGNG